MTQNEHPNIIARIREAPPKLDLDRLDCMSNNQCCAAPAHRGVFLTRTILANEQTLMPLPGC